MSTAPTQTSEGLASAALAFLEDLLAGYHPRDFAVRLWDGSRWTPEKGRTARFTLVLEHPGSLRQMFLPPRVLTLCESYINGDIDIEGDVEAFWRLARYLYMGGAPKGTLERRSLEGRLAPFPVQGRPRGAPLLAGLSGTPHSLERDRQAVPATYGTSNDFYAMWLDRRMVYSCAYFTSPDQELDVAQEQKLDHVCRKLRLQPGERFLDIGCGWGGLILHAAQRYGVEAVGITITPEQAACANERIRAAGMEGRCRVVLGDYRELEGHAAYDKMASVGFIEHVGEALYESYFRQALDLLIAISASGQFRQTLPHVLANAGRETTVLLPCRAGRRRSRAGPSRGPTGRARPVRRRSRPGCPCRRAARGEG